MTTSFTSDTDATTTTTDQPGATAARKGKGHLMLGVLPFIGVILFVINARPILADRTGDWKLDLLQAGVVNMIGIAALGAGISHLFFGKAISASIGWATSPYETEVAFANLAFGVVGLMAAGQAPAFWFAVILASSLYRMGCGVGHIRQMVQNHDFAPNNTSILFLNFVVPAFLLYGWFAWAA